MLQNSKRKRITHNLWTARSLQIWFDAEKNIDVEALQSIAKALEKEGKKVKILGYFHQKTLKTPPNFDFLTKKSISFWGKLIDAKAIEICQTETDLLLVFNPKHHWTLEMMALVSPAKMKIGCFTHLPEDFDLMIDLPSDATAQQFLHQLDTYLDKIIVSNEPVFAKV